MAISGWIVTAWLLAEAGPDPALRIQAIRTGLTVGAGVGGTMALLLAVRRQWLNERTQAHEEDDAVERRVTELSAHAAEQLGHEQAIVRISGLHTLERLGRDHPAYRQRIVDQICAYLRMPYTHLADLPEEDQAGIAFARVELNVRLTAQQILSRHLSYAEFIEGTPFTNYWPGMAVDLTGATFVELMAVQWNVQEISCRQACFVGTATFTGLISSYSMDFSAATFHGEVRLHDVRCDGWAVFTEAKFGMRANFGDSHFGEGASFENCRFDGAVGFADATFGLGPDFEGATVAAQVEVNGLPDGWRVEDDPDSADGRKRLVRDAEPD